MHLLSADKHHSQLNELENEQADIELLHGISTQLIAEQDPVELYGKIVDAAVAISRSQFGTMQLLCPQDDPSGHAGELSLLCSRGLPPEAVGVWQWVRPEAHSSCARALRSGRREIVDDYEEWDLIAGTEDLLAFRRAGIRAAQTTPLLSRDGNLLGMISTHWTEPHQPTDRDLRLLDILARQAADLLERTIAEDLLRGREQDLDRTCAALRDTEALQRLLTAELSHRVKNMLATVQAIASQTLRNCDDPIDFVQSFGGRIQSMARVHSQLSVNEWKATQLHEIVHDQMKFGPVDEAQIAASGPPVYLDAASVPHIAMMLHELGTNSLKYGALSTVDGKVTIAWTALGQTLELVWTDHGGPAVKVPLKRGFGTKLIESTARGAGGEARMFVEPDGVQWKITLPVPVAASTVHGTTERSTVEAEVAPASGPRDPVALGKLAGKRFLVVEDEPMLAMDMAEKLEDVGARVIGPAGNASDALSLIDQYRLDGALLDANLSGDPVDEIAASLSGKNVPFVFVSGYDKGSLPKSFAHVELLSKPFEGRQLLAAAVKLLE